MYDFSIYKSLRSSIHRRKMLAEYSFKSFLRGLFGPDNAIRLLVTISRLCQLEPIRMTIQHECADFLYLHDILTSINITCLPMHESKWLCFNTFSHKEEDIKSIAFKTSGASERYILSVEEQDSFKAFYRSEWIPWLIYEINLISSATQIMAILTCTKY